MKDKEEGRKRIEAKKAITAEKLFENNGYKFPEFEEFVVEPKLLRERVQNAEKFSNRICFIRENVALFNLVKARIKELGLTNQDIGYHLHTDRANIHKFFKRGIVGAISQAKYLLLLELLNIQVKMSFSLVEKFDRKARYGIEEED
jgi:hypothetical protein